MAISMRATFNLLASLMGGMVAQHASPVIAREWPPRATRGDAIIGLGLTGARGAPMRPI